jgi:hypothetical protein
MRKKTNATVEWICSSTAVVCALHFAGFLSCKPARNAFDEHRAMSQGDLFSTRTASTGSTSEITLQERKEAEPATTTSNSRVFGIHSMVTCVCGATLLDEEVRRTSFVFLGMRFFKLT